jgi:uncharacterized repeat protein (TIGR04138 family)
MPPSDIEKLREIIITDPRYPVDAYLFVLEALFYTRKKVKAETHVTGQELLDGIKDLALERYGPLAKMVFEHWGIRETIDFGNIVFNMVNCGLLGKTEQDRIEDFFNGYDFEKVFVRDYKPVLKKINFSK